jgi:hypothetical protein
MGKKTKQEDFAKRLNKAVDAAAGRRRQLAASRPSAAVLADSLTVLADADTILASRTDGRAVLAKSAAAVLAAGVPATTTAGFGKTAQEMLVRVGEIMDKPAAERMTRVDVLRKMRDAARSAVEFQPINRIYMDEQAIVGAIPAAWAKSDVPTVSPTPARLPSLPRPAPPKPGAVDVNAIARQVAAQMDPAAMVAKAVKPLHDQLDAIEKQLSDAKAFLTKGGTGR